MNLQTYFAQHSTDEIRAVAQQAQVSFAYLQLCKYGNRRMSADLAIKLEWASGGLMTAREMRPDLPWPSCAKHPTSGA